MTDNIERLLERMLVLRIQSGDDRAFVELIERYHGRLRYYVRRLLPDAADSDDILQDVWLSVTRKIRTLRDPSAVSVWLYRVARNSAFMQLRRNRQPVEPLNESAVVEYTDEDDSDFSSEDAARIHAALGRLRPEHQEVLLLRFLEQMSYEQIAEVVGAPLGTVRSRLHYAKRELREQMGE